MAPVRRERSEKISHVDCLPPRRTGSEAIRPANDKEVTTRHFEYLERKGFQQGLNWSFHGCIHSVSAYRLSSEGTQQMLNALAVFGDAQKAWTGKKKDCYLAKVSYNDFGVGAKGEDSHLSSVFSKLKERLWEHLHESILICKRGEYYLGAVVKNRDRAERYLER